MLSYSLVLLILLFFGNARKPPNACNEFHDYLKASRSKNCFYNPDMFLETPELVEKYAGKVESYKITTEDGYILTMFRIPRDNATDSILLQHPLTVNSRMWVALGNKSLAFHLWRNGYDIWLNNARGTLFSQSHQKLNKSDYQFWDYSFHEIGFYDIPSQIKLIKSQTKRTKILFIGHSMGTTTGLIYASVHSEEARNSIKAFVFMSMSCYYKYATSPIKLLVPYEKTLMSLKLSNVIPNWVSQITAMLFRLFPALLMGLNLLIASLFGWTPSELDPAVLNFDAFIYVKSFSYKLLMHYLQIIRTESVFQMFDYGKVKNLKIYKSKEPPRYPIEKVSVPVLLISSDNDTFTTAKDADLLHERLPEHARIYEHMKVYGLNHIDFMVGRHIQEIYFGKLLNFLKKVSRFNPE